MHGGTPFPILFPSAAKVPLLPRKDLRGANTRGRTLECSDRNTTWWMAAWADSVTRSPHGSHFARRPSLERGCDQGKGSTSGEVPRQFGGAPWY